MRQGSQADFLMKDKTASEGTKRATKGDDILSEGLSEEGHLKEGEVAAEGTATPWARRGQTQFTEGPTQKTLTPSKHSA